MFKLEENGGFMGRILVTLKNKTRCGNVRGDHRYRILIEAVPDPNY
jgi:hypothetical protein